MTIKQLSVDEFWATIDAAWDALDDPEVNTARRALLTPTSQVNQFEAAMKVSAAVDAMLDKLRPVLESYTSRQLCVWDAHCERALYDIDREDVHEALEGSDDGFLYARGFVVAVGKAYYDAVAANPAKYGLDFDAESMCYFAAHIHHDRFGEWTGKTDISRETGSNAAGWPSG